MMEVLMRGRPWEESGAVGHLSPTQSSPPKFREHMNAHGDAQAHMHPKQQAFNQRLSKCLWFVEA